MTSALRKLLLLGLSIAGVGIVLFLYSRFAGTKTTNDHQQDGGTPNGVIDVAIIKRIGSADTNLDSAKKLEYYQRGAGGRVERVYRAEQFKLESEDQARLEEVTFVWYLKNGQNLTLTSDTGLVNIDRARNRMQPTSGRLSGNVRIVFQFPKTSESQQSLRKNKTEELIITTNELDFDTRSCRLWTDRAVQLHGTDLDATGTGLLLRWREISQDIDRLIIQRGGELTWRGVKGRGFDNLFQEQDSTEESTTDPGASSEADIEPERIHSYLATFNEDVRITYNDRQQVQTIRNMDQLKVLFDLLLPDQSSEDEPSPVTDVDKEPSPKHSDDTQLSPPLILTWNGPLTIVPAEQSVEQSPERRRLRCEASGSPVTFYTRDVSGSCAKLQAEQNSGIVRLSSSNDFGVFLESPDGASITTEQLLIDPPIKDTRLIHLLGQGNLKTIDKTSQPISSAVHNSQPVDLSWQESATLKFVRQIQSPDAQARQLEPTALQTDLKDRFYLSEATANGGVVVISEQSTSKANMIHIELDPPGSDGTDKSQAIRTLRAKDEFSADLPSKTGILTISADYMETKFGLRSSGKGQFASSIDLKSNVLATEKTENKQSESKLKCGKMLIILTEQKNITTEEEEVGYGSAAVSKLVAEENVIGHYLVEGETRSSLHADRLIADESSHTTTLYGSAADLAELKRGDNDRLRSDTIVITEIAKTGKTGEKDKYYVLTTPGAGDMRATFSTSEDNSSSALLGLEWAKSLKFDGEDDKAIFEGLGEKRVKGAISHSPTSSSQFAADRLELYLQDKEQTPQPEKDTPAEDIASSETFFKPMSDKKLEKMVLTGQAEVGNIEHPIGTPQQRLRSVWLRSNVLTYKTYDNQERQFYGDGPGSLLLEDYRPTDKEISDDQTASMPGGNKRRQPRGMSMQRVGPGQTVFDWKTSSKYSQNARTAVLYGDVYMVSMGYALALPERSPKGTQPQENKRHRTQLWCQTFTVTFAEPETGESQESKSNFADLSAMDELEIERIEASIDVSLLSKDIRIEDAQSIIYNRKTGEIVIEGSRKSKASVTYLDPQKGQWVEWTGKLARYNVSTGELEAKGNFRVLSY